MLILYKCIRIPSYDKIHSDVTVKQGWPGVYQEYNSLKKWSDLMPINVTVTNSGKISLQVFIIKILLFTLADSRLNTKVYIFSLGAVTDYIRCSLVTQKTQD